MPAQWVENHLAVSGDNPTVLDFVSKAVGFDPVYKDSHTKYNPIVGEYQIPLSFHALVPIPADMLSEMYDPIYESTFWGCKWGSMHTKTEIRYGEALYIFSTADDRPKPFMVAVSKKFPSLLFVLDWKDSDEFGTMVAQNGVVKEEIHEAVVDEIFPELVPNSQVGDCTEVPKFTSKNMTQFTMSIETMGINGETLDPNNYLLAFYKEDEHQAGPWWNTVKKAWDDTSPAVATQWTKEFVLSNPIPHNICGKWEAVADIQSAWKCAWCGYVFDQDVSAPVHTYLECEFEQFLAAYIEAALFTCNDESDESGGEPLDKNYGPSDISELAWKSMEEDCRNFLADNYKDLIKSDDWILMGGHNFWMSRCGHGTGFFDADQWSPAVRSRLQKAAKVWGDCHLYVGDDKKIYVG